VITKGFSRTMRRLAMGACLARPAGGAVVYTMALGIALAFRGGTWGQCEEAKLIDLGPGTPAANLNGVAAAVSGDGDTAVVGVPYDNDSAGSARVFVRDGSSWSQEAKLTASDGRPFDRLGWAVALSADGTTLVAGAICDDDNGQISGSAYVFVRDRHGGWSQQAKLLPLDGDEGDYFGWSVSLSAGGDSALVSSLGDSDGGSGAGSAYVFQRDSADHWTQQAKLIASDAAGGDHFGRSVSLSRLGDTALIGAPGNDDAGSSAGSAYVFGQDDHGAWGEQAKLLASDGAARDDFGWSVSLSGDGETAIVGAPDHDNDGFSGSAYVFSRSSGTWSEQSKLHETDVEPGSDTPEFGRAVAIDGYGDLIVVGAPKDGEFWWRGGAVYVYLRDGSSWVRLAKLTASDKAEQDRLGFSVAVSADGETAVAGTVRFSEAGSVYVFNLEGPDCNNNGFCDARDLAEGESEDVNKNQIPDECEMAAPQCQPDRLLSSDASVDDAFGWSVAIWGDTALVGAIGDSENGYYSGSAYVFGKGALWWSQEQKLLPDDGVAYDQFGRSVDLWGDTAVIGAWEHDENGSDAGAAYVFRHDGTSWIEEAKLLPVDGTLDGWFGSSVAVSGSAIVVGAPRDYSGAAYVFRYDGSSWVPELTRFFAGDGAAGDFLGASVAISGDVAVIGAPGDDDNGGSSGSAYELCFDGSTWVEGQKILPTDGSSGDSFGGSVSISGDALVVGASGNDSAYVFRQQGPVWVQEQKLRASDGAPLSGAAIFGDTVIAGAPTADETGYRSGSAYEFRFDGSTWKQVRKIVPLDGGLSHHFGFGLAIAGRTALISSPKDNHAGEHSGSAYVFDLSGPCSGDVNGDGLVNGVDLGILLDNWGVCPDPPDFCPSDLNGDDFVDIADLLILLANWG
jgi:hypothetical protein